MLFRRKKKPIVNVPKAPMSDQPLRSADESEFEICVLCGKLTSVRKTETLEDRIDYLPGAGQLCRECAAQNATEEYLASRRGFTYSIPCYQEDKSNTE